MKWYRVRELYYYDGRVTSELSGTIQAKARPESEIIERDDYSEFIDWYDTKEHAKPQSNTQERCPRKAEYYN